MESNLVTQIQEEVAQIVRPLTERLLTLDSEIAEREQELNELRKARTQFRNLLKGIDPSLDTDEVKPKKKRTQPGAESINAVLEFLQSREGTVNENGGFHASGLAARYGEEIPVSRATLNKALVVLHQQGAIRLVSTGTGGAKFYKVAS